jgi:hypothetical protein
MFLGYRHPSGEVHIMDNNEWVSCPGKNYVSRIEGGKKLTGHNLPIGQDNPSKECIVGDVPTILEGNLSDHDGPYNGVTMGC